MGRPVAGAHVHLYSAIIVGGAVRFSDSGATDVLGRIRFAKRREWHALLMLVPDGEAPWVWAWCADAEGMQPTYGRLDEPPRDTIRVSLSTPGSGSNGRCPAKPAALSALPITQ
jgi:hypothetical protein